KNLSPAARSETAPDWPLTSSFVCESVVTVTWVGVGSDIDSASWMNDNGFRSYAFATNDPLVESTETTVPATAAFGLRMLVGRPGMPMVGSPGIPGRVNAWAAAVPNISGTAAINASTTRLM